MMRAARVANAFDFVFELTEMARANAVGDGAKSVAELPRLAPGANHGVQGKFCLAGRYRLLELRTLHYELHLIGHVMQDKRRVSQEKRCFIGRENSLGQNDKVNGQLNHEPWAFRTRNKAGGCPALQTLSRDSDALAEQRLMGRVELRLTRNR